ncbi:RloB family protein [Streptosporangium sp. NPDC051022]|uniref:RloB family protein n=1 Tax=Streptosporangium sp. NPDC051022 TaxID=3155752 RepID=UPI00344A8ECF
MRRAIHDGRGRKPSKAAARRSLLVFTEGEKTETIYLQHWYRLHRDRVIVTFGDFHGVPLRLVEEARDRKKADLREQKRGRGAAYDEYWCVFDVDEHPNLRQATELAAAHGINLAVSNPCLELWFLLHLKEQWASLDRHDAQSQVRELLGCGKVLTPAALARLAELHDQAVSRALALEGKHRGDGSPSRANPSTDIWRLVERIRTAGV